MFARKTPFGFYSLYFILGAAIGGAVALLFAPTTGRKLQKQLKDVIDDQVENVQKYVKKTVNA